jgi:hypothetical protein
MANSKPIVCTLSNAERRGRGVKWKDALRAAGAHITDTPGGVLISFENGGRSDSLDEIAELVRMESRCCAWMNLELRRAGTHATLAISSGSEEGAHLIQAMVRAGV